MIGIIEFEIEGQEDIPRQVIKIGYAAKVMLKAGFTYHLATTEDILFTEAIVGKTKFGYIECLGKTSGILITYLDEFEKEIINFDAQINWIKEDGVKVWG